MEHTGSTHNGYNLWGITRQGQKVGQQYTIDLILVINTSSCIHWSWHYPGMCVNVNTRYHLFAPHYDQMIIPDYIFADIMIAKTCKRST